MHATTESTPAPRPPRWLPTRIISGGQTGADRAALLFAESHGIAFGGWCPADRRAEDGTVPLRFGLRPTPSRGYTERTTANVRDGDATIVFNAGDQLSAGSRLTVDKARLIRTPCLVVDTHLVRHFLQVHHPVTLNVADNRESVAPGTTLYVQQVLTQCWQWQQDYDLTADATDPRPPHPVGASPSALRR